LRTTGVDTWKRKRVTGYGSSVCITLAHLITYTIALQFWLLYAFVKYYKNKIHSFENRWEGGAQWD